MTTEWPYRGAIGDLGELLARHTGGADRRSLTSYRDRPVAFIREVLQEEPWDRQVEIAEAVAEHAQVTVRSCNAAGKDWLVARLALWWCYARRGLVVLTGPTVAQVEEILMRGEVRDAFVRVDLSGELHVHALRPGGVGRAGILAKTASDVSALTGFHQAEVLFVLTESQGVERHAWDAAFAVTTGADDRILAVGNPLEPAGPFYRSHRPSSGWHSIHIPASAVPNVRENRVVIPGLITREGVDRMAREYGKNSAYVQARVRAEFPEQGSGALFRRQQLEDAAKRCEAWQQDGSPRGSLIPVVALDPARYGPDDSVMAIRHGNVISDLVVWEGRTSTTELANNVERALEDRGYRAGGARSERIRAIVDEVGLGGGVLDRLKERGWTARGFNGGRKAIDSERYVNRRAEAYWRLFQQLDGENPELGILWNDALVEELLAVRWRATTQGQLQLESKRDMEARLGRSPDRADAVAMACYPWTRVGRSGSQKWTQLRVISR